MSKIIMLRGNSGSGKTTTAKELQKRLGYGTMLISQDVVRREMIYVKDRPDNQAIDLLQNLVAFSHANCEVTILEGILYVKFYKNLFDTISELFNSNIYAYYFDIPFEETLKRHNQKPNANDYGEVEMRCWWEEKDFLPSITEKLLNEKMSKEEVVDLIYNDVKEKRQMSCTTFSSKFI